MLANIVPRRRVQVSRFFRNCEWTRTFDWILKFMNCITRLERRSSTNKHIECGAHEKSHQVSIKGPGSEDIIWHALNDKVCEFFGGGWEKRTFATWICPIDQPDLYVFVQFKMQHRRLQSTPKSETRRTHHPISRWRRRENLINLHLVTPYVFP